MKGWLDKYQDGGSTSDGAIKSFLRGLVTPEVQRSDAPAMIKTAPRDQSIESKAWDALTHPVTAFKHLVRDGRLPNNFAAAAPLGIDTALDITGLNPLGYMDMAMNTAKSAGKLVSGNGSLGDFLAVPAGALGLAPGLNTARKIVGRHLESNSNIYSPIINTIGDAANKVGSKVSQVDQKLGKKVFKQKGNLPKVPSVDPSDLESIINYNLKKGQGVKKVDIPVEVKVRQDPHSAPGNNFVVDNIIGGNRVGSVQLRQNLAPYQSPSFSRGIMDIVNPQGNKWINTPGFQKVADFPFTETYYNPVEYAGKKYFHDDLVKTGLSGELNKAINETLKANNLGNILSGGTGHTNLGRSRWENLVKKGHAENLGGDKYILKKNGGWLEKYNDGGPVQENYNDYSVSAPEGFVGEGFSNVGRNYSPAWGGQFENGGSLPIAQGGKNVPATKQDSLNLYNNAKQVLNYYNSKKYQKVESDFNKLRNNSRLTPEIYSDDITVANQAALKKFREANKIKTSLFGNITGGVKVPLSSGKAELRQIPESTYYRKINNDTYYQRELINSILDTRSPMQLFDKRIAPTMRNSYVNNNTQDSMYQDRISLNLYDPILVKPESMLTAEERAIRIKKYGPSSVSTNETTKSVVNPKSKSTPLSTKKPVVNQKLQPTSQSTIDWIEGNNSSEEFVPEVQQPIDINPIGIVEDRQTGYRHEYRKSTGELFIPFRGGQTYVDPNNPRNNPKPKMAMGGSLPGAVGFTYARTINPAPSNGPYAKKTKASAQDGTTIYSGMLPEITVVGSKDPQTEEYYRGMMDRLAKEEAYRQGLLPYSDEYIDIAFDDPISTKNILGRYEGLMDLGKKYGFPKVHPKDPNSIFAAASKLSDTELELGPRPNYNPFTKTIQASSSKNWLDEMAHHVQFKNNPISTGFKFLTNDVPAYISGKSPYAKPGTMEHEAHSIIEPKLEEEIETSKRNYRQLPYIQKLTQQFYGPIENYQNGGEMKYYQQGLDFKPKTISKNGSVIKDDRGQWAHPGEITEISSNQITMQGVPYPVLGISDTGDTQMMYPNQDYTYEGSSVTEYPIAQNGRNVAYVDSVLNANKNLNWVKRLYDVNRKSIMLPGEKYPATHFMESGDGRVYPTVVEMPDGKLKHLGNKAYDYADSTNTFIQFPNDDQATWFGENYKLGTNVLKKKQQGMPKKKQGGQLTKLDQLTNFTNYNTKQPGGWLDKYQD